MSNENDYQGEDSLAKSNFLINSKYKSTLNCQKVMYSALFMIQEKKYQIDPETKEIQVSLTASELVRMLDLKKSGTIHSYLEPIAKQMVNTTIGMSDPENDTFEYMALITDAKYKDGIFTAAFNSRLQDYIINLKQNFTKLPRTIMMSWKSIYSYRMYELLRQRAYYPKSYSGPKNGIFTVTYDVYELRLLLGVVNSNLVAVQTVLNGTNPPNYRKACEASPEKSYNDWGHFKTKVIDKAIKEINDNDMSEIKIEYEPLKKAHGEVYSVKFTIYLTDLYHKKYDDIPEPATIVEDDAATTSLSQVDKFVIQMNVFVLLEQYQITHADVINICEVAKYDYESIETAANILQHNKSKVDNVTGWIISAIKHSYSMPTSHQPETKTNVDFAEKQDYGDMEELEKKLLDN